LASYGDWKQTRLCRERERVTKESALKGVGALAWWLFLSTDRWLSDAAGTSVDPDTWEPMPGFGLAAAKEQPRTSDPSIFIQRADHFFPLPPIVRQPLAQDGQPIDLDGIFTHVMGLLLDDDCTGLIESEQDDWVVIFGQAQERELAYTKRWEAGDSHLVALLGGATS
jgi:hypothetical protein